jgi:hypothetical protein
MQSRTSHEEIELHRQALMGDLAALRASHAPHVIRSTQGLATHADIASLRNCLKHEVKMFSKDVLIRFATMWLVVILFILAVTR